MKHLLKKEYPSLTNKDYKKALAFICGKCSQYYFLDYMRCSNGNVDDAIKFYLLDFELRPILFRYIIELEIQMKSDFSSIVKKTTKCNHFWEIKKHYIPEATLKDSRGRRSTFDLLIEKINLSVKKMIFKTRGPSNDVALYATTFGTFEQLFKLIKNDYLKEFILKYTKTLDDKTYKTLKNFIEGIRRVRNRCCHGNHIITLKMVNDLNDLRFSLTNKTIRSSIKNHISSLESIILFIVDNVSSGNVLKKKLLKIYDKNYEILSKYSGKHSLSSNLNLFY